MDPITHDGYAFAGINVSFWRQESIWGCHFGAKVLCFNC